MKEYDVIIIGGGPAGMNAAMYAARKEMRAAVITTDFGGQILLTSEIENYLGFPSISGFELSDKMEAHVRQYPVDFETAQVERLERLEDGSFAAHLDDGQEYRGKACIVTKAEPHAGYSRGSVVYRTGRQLLRDLRRAVLQE